jgi:DNA polymerase III epsilon subunit-like protein
VNYNHIMLDLETLGTRPGDTILSIGAVWFTPEGEEKSTFYCTINQESSKAAGLRAQKSTIEWWQKQSPEAREAAFKGELGLESALKQFSMWLPPGESNLIYGNGANFDNTLLAAAYRALKQEVPWKYWNDRCYRTISAMFQKSRVERTGTYHNALDDARTQAKRLTHMAQESGLTLK